MKLTHYPARDEVRRRAELLRSAPKLAGLRDRELLALLPADEQRACAAVWQAADALLFRVGARD